MIEGSEGGKGIEGIEGGEGIKGIEGIEGSKGIKGGKMCLTQEPLSTVNQTLTADR
jgi:hypothetical protein